MEANEFLEQFPHGIVVLDENDDIAHLCGYPSPPKMSDVDALQEELRTDKEFKLDFEAHTYTMCFPNDDLWTKIIKDYL